MNLASQNQYMFCLNSSCIVHQTPKNRPNEAVTTERRTTKVKTYHINLEIKKDFLSALLWCYEYDMKLASITSNDENEKFLSTIKQLGESNSDIN